MSSLHSSFVIASEAKQSVIPVYMGTTKDENDGIDAICHPD